jgi:alpha-N-acetylglucosaminidase
MKILGLWIYIVTVAAAQPTTLGIVNLLARRLPDHVDNFIFQLTTNTTGRFTSKTTPVNDEYIISSMPDGKILVEGNSQIALASG